MLDRAQVEAGGGDAPGEIIPKVIVHKVLPCCLVRPAVVGRRAEMPDAAVMLLRPDHGLSAVTDDRYRKDRGAAGLEHAVQFRKGAIDVRDVFERI